MTTGNELIIKTEGVKVNFGDFWALNGIDIEVTRGEIIVILGPSGSGKSTFIRTLNRLQPHSGGTIEIDGITIDEDTSIKDLKYVRSEVGFVFQQFNLIPFLTVEGNLRLAGRFSREPRRDFRDKSENLLQALNLDLGLLQRRADTLSVGQQQRVAIARALINDPELLLADEPTSALDADTRDTFMSLLMSIRDASDCTMIFASHDRSLMKYFDTEIELSEVNRAQKGKASRV